jgi:acyl-CoA reductase-like NAD-dependent aldehyde dehydrogenase
MWPFLKRISKSLTSTALVAPAFGQVQLTVTSEPVGIVAALIPWNVPHTIAVMKTALALIVGCMVVLRPAPEAPLDAHLLAEMLDEASSQVRQIANVPVRGM